MQRLDELVVQQELSEEIVHPLRARLRDRLKRVQRRDAREGEREQWRLVDLHDEIEFSLIAAEREHINDLYKAGKLKDEARRRIERELDLRDAQLNNVRAEE